MLDTLKNLKVKRVIRFDPCKEKPLQIRWKRRNGISLSVFIPNLMVFSQQVKDSGNW
jgi:hypothetical protein